MLFASVFVAGYAATAGRQPVQPAGVIGDPGKGKQGQRVYHRVFEKAGTKPGTEIWRIEVIIVPISSELFIRLTFSVTLPNIAKLINKT